MSTAVFGSSAGTIPFSTAPQHYIDRSVGGMGLGWTNSPDRNAQKWNQTLQEMYGPPTIPNTMSWHDSQAVSQRLFPERWRNSNLYMASNIIRAVSDEINRGILKHLGAIVVWEGFSRVTVEEHIYNKTQMDQVPELGVGRTQTQQFRSWTSKTKRYQHAFKASAEWFDTDAGKIDYTCQMTNISLAFTDLLILNALFTALCAPINASAVMAEWFKNGFSTVANSIEKALDAELDTWGILSQAGGPMNMLRVLFAIIDARFDAQGHSGTAAKILLPHGTKKEFDVLPPDWATSAVNGKAGFDMADKGSYLNHEASRAGHTIHEVGQFLIEHGKPEACPLVFDRSIGMHTVFTQEKCHHSAGDNVEDVIIADFQLDVPVRIKYRDMFIGSGLFDHSDKMNMRFASLYFEQFRTLRAWINKYKTYVRVPTYVNKTGASVVQNVIDSTLRTGSGLNRGALLSKQSGNPDVNEHLNSNYAVGEFVSGEFSQVMQPHLSPFIALISREYSKIPDVIRIAVRAFLVTVFAHDHPVHGDLADEKQFNEAAKKSINIDHRNSATLIVNVITSVCSILNEIIEEDVAEDDTDAATLKTRRVKIWTDLLRSLGDTLLIQLKGFNTNNLLFTVFGYLDLHSDNWSELHIMYLTTALTMLTSHCDNPAVRSECVNLSAALIDAIGSDDTDDFEKVNDEVKTLVVAAGKKYMSSASAVSIVDKDISLVTLDEYITLVESGEVPFTSFLLLRPHVTFSMGSALALAPNSLTTFVGSANFIMGTEVTQNRVEGNFHAYTNCVATKPSGIVHVPNVKVQAYRYGGGSKVWDVHNQEAVEAYQNRNGLYNRQESMFIIPLVPGENAAAARWINMSPRQTQSYSLGAGVYTPVLMAAYAQFWNFNTTTRVGPNHYFGSTSTSNVFTCNEWSACTDKKDKSRLHQCLVQPSWFDWCFYPGACKALCGQGRERVNRNKNVSEMIGSCMPVDIFDRRDDYQRTEITVSF